MTVPYYKRKIKFVRVACKHCGYDQILYTFATTRIKCFNCQKFLMIPKGGKCELTDCKVIEKLE